MNLWKIPCISLRGSIGLKSSVRVPNTMFRLKRLPFIAILIAFLLVGAALLAIPLRRNSARAAAMSNPAPQAVKPAVPADNLTPAAPVAPPGTIFYSAKRGDTMPGLLHKYLWQSTYMTPSEFEAAIREMNGGLKGVYLPGGQEHHCAGHAG